MDEIKTIAMYLPQFHEIPENSRWWGEGYTDWTAVKKAEPLLEGHNQPREPLEDNYYNLLEKSTMEQQAELAKKYALDGFCFYHYYFKNGKKILEQPAENLLKWKDLEMPFCFCWANESWARTWSRAKNKNVWADKFEAESHDKKDEVLLEQKYGREQAWEEHFNYLLPFFEDKRYIRQGDAPVFLITIPGNIIGLAEMICFWKTKAREHGISDIYVIGLSTERRLNGLDAVLINGPSRYLATTEQYWKSGVRCYDYDAVWESALRMQKIPDCKTYFGGFVDYDDTPRRGENGVVFEGACPDKFGQYIYQLMKKNKTAGNEYVFINAFNEWGEGMYLEPDKKNGSKYLEALLDMKRKVNGEKLQIKPGAEEAGPARDDDWYDEKLEKFRSYFSIMDQWMTLRESGVHLSDYLRQYEYNKVAIYGMGILGKHLIKELTDDGVDVRYIIDRKEEHKYNGIEVCKINNNLEQVDAIIVTAIHEYDTIWKSIRSCGITFPVVSLEELICEQ